MVNKKGNSWWIWILVVGAVLIVFGFTNNSEDTLEKVSDSESIPDNIVDISGKVIDSGEGLRETTRELDKVQEPIQNSIKVSYVIDGDTIKLSTGESVRLIGINAPEKGEKCYEEAKTYLEEWVLENEDILLEEDIEDKDQYGRLLRYVFVDVYNVNHRMILEGLAHKYEYGSNTKYSSLFEEAENKAKENKGCLWEKSEEDYADCFIITNFHFNAEGNDNYNLNDEYVTLKNKCNYQIDMGGWTIKDNTASHIYYFPQFIVSGESSFTLYTGIGTDTNTKLYWERQEGNYAAIWNNNGGDTLFLRDEIGNLVLTKSYEGYS